MLVLRNDELALLRDRLNTESEKLLTIKDENGLDISHVFNFLPAKMEYPDYYIIIKHPIAFDTIRKRLPHYIDPQDFITDAFQIPWNAKTYNAKGSIIYSYADRLDSFLRNITLPNLKRFYPELVIPDLGPLPDETRQSSTTGNTSSTNNKREFENSTVNRQNDTLKANKLQKSFLITNTQAPSTVFPMEQNSITIEGNNTNGGNYEPNQYISQNPMQIIHTIPAVIDEATRQTQNGQHQFSHVSPSMSPLSQPQSFSPTPQPMQSNIEMNPNGNMTHQIQRTVTTAQIKPANARKGKGRRGRPPIIDLPYIQRMKNILKSLKRDIDPTNNKPILSYFDKFPDGALGPMIANPICLDDIWKKIKTRRYRDFQSFQFDFNSMLSNYKELYQNDPMKAPRAHIIQSSFNHFLTLELQRPDSDYVPEGHYRIPLDEVYINNDKYSIGDWVLLYNPNDATTPIVGQIFRFWVTPDGQKWLNACWYLRPEQTVHRVDRLFYKHEVVKTGQYRDHRIEDIQGHCYVVHFTRYQRGDPELKVDGPLFICEFRYNENDKVFNKIRTWRACLPEEIRDVDEVTVPINRRKFFKYPSPIRHLLPPNATINDPIPQATEGAANAPPLIGAVYLRPKVEKDDLGEYSTSDDCPRYIIRPNDPQEQGTIDYENGTIIPTYKNNYSTSGYASNRTQSVKQHTQPMAQNNNSKIMTAATTTMRNTTPMTLQNKIPAVQNNKFPIRPSKPTPLTTIPTQRRPTPPQHTTRGPYISHIGNKNRIQKEQQRKEQIKYRLHKVKSKIKQTPTDLTTAINALTTHTSKSTNGQIVLSAPSAYVLPTEISLNNEPLSTITTTLQCSDLENQLRRYTKEELMIKKRSQRDATTDEVIWFRGPSIFVKNRLLNMGSEPFQVPLNRWFLDSNLKRRKLDYEEVEETIDDDPNKEEDTQVLEEGVRNELDTELKLEIPGPELAVSTKTDTNNFVNRGLPTVVTNDLTLSEGVEAELSDNDDEECLIPCIDLTPSARFLCYKLAAAARKTESRTSI
ncbi:uncharacterized protein NDAI_0J01940 [Naumovozyma dairenensis CBS 421]|uniref:BAH domain-containing protein n=1 Tax=Naumovozyma dairenensis (strain ATCC 10597 / BCRC 20456 / CBS 421 / NBRC 0211 / NRRL Y-12639) TaxID=1071378 RepID=G0WH08_NAUDC|nr:hypothetical protein NDAI_0J01940 [Naumovozyma dairenensis CBS 421]CCD27086.1 hypothetical protein NDAI_0J01940 [Naumovozyma dairenensis CBS 421]